MPSSPLSMTDLSATVRAVFANRPTLRQVLGEKLMAILLKHYPLIAVHRPDMKSAEPLFLMIPRQDGGWKSEPLVEVLLQAMLDATVLDFSDVGGLDFRFSLQPPHRFFAIESELETAEGDMIRPRELEADFNALLPLLHEHLCDAQIRYWNGDDSDMDRGLWLQQMLRLSLFAGLRNAALDSDQRSCLHDLLLGKTAGFTVQAVRLQLQAGDSHYQEILPNLLVTASNEVRNLLLWCAPTGEVRSFDSMQAFAIALQAQMNVLYRFDSMTWSLLDDENDPFALQMSLLLEALLQRLARVRRSVARTVDEYEDMYAQACDPSLFFAPLRGASGITQGVKLPGKLKRASKDEQTAYAQAMLDLAILQSASGGNFALEGIDDLHTYTVRRLREEMLADHPVDANYFSDDLLLTVETYANDGHGLGFKQTIDRRTITLTEWAIGRLEATQTGVITAIKHRQDQLIMHWLTVDYLRDVLDRVDVGGSYPLYVNAEMNDAEQREQRFARFSEQWRLTLHFDAVRARITKAIDVAVYRGLEQFCRQGKTDLGLARLAFKRSPTSQVIDPVHGMYVIKLREPSVLLLYCPLYTNKALQQFADAQALFAAISEPGKLQDAALMWMEQSQRAIYDNGGFKEPHLPHWPSDPFETLEKPAPAVLVTQFIGQGLDAFMFESRHKLMLEVAERSAMSNSEQRWAVIKAFSWELLNVAFPVLPGPLACVAWLYAGMRGMADDVKALSSHDDAATIEATVDILNNTLMALVHLQLPTPAKSLAPVETPRSWVADLPLGDGLGSGPSSLAEPGDAIPISTLQQGVETALDFSWRGAGGLNGLSREQLNRLRQLVSDVSVEGHNPEQHGPAAGLYKRGDRYFAVLTYEVYEVELVDDGIWIVGPDNTYGPELTSDYGNWRIKSGLFGGAGRNPAREGARQKIEAKITAGFNELTRHLEAAGHETSRYLELDEQFGALGARLDALNLKLQEPPPTEPAKLELYKTMHALFRQKQQEVTTQLGLKRDERLESVIRLFHGYLGAEKSVVALLDNPSFVRRTDRSGPARNTLLEVRQSLVGFGIMIIDEVVSMSMFAQFDALVDELNSLPANRQAGVYKRYISMLDDIVVQQPKIIEASSELDRLLALSDANLQIPYGDETLTLEAIIAKRNASTVAIRFFQAMNLAELGLQYRKNANARLLTFRQALTSERLRVAANAHELSLYCELSVAERIEVLQTAWDEYVSAILNCERLKGLGDELVDVQRLEAYKQQMIELRAMAADALIDAMREQAAGQALAPRRAVYQRKSLQVAHTREGQIVIGDETIIDGQPVLQIKPALSNDVRHTFHREGTRWVEDVLADVSPIKPLETSPEIEAKTIAAAQKLLEGNDQVIESAKQMVQEDADDSGLRDLLDGQVNNLSSLADQLPAVAATQPLLKRLQSAISQLETQKNQLLTELYSQTRYPKARGLAFLHEQGLISVEYEGPRRKDADGYLDEYRISLKSSSGKKGKTLWAAHFHFADAQAAPTAFGKGHLKLWAQRLQGYKSQMQAAKAGQVLRIYRGNLSYEQAKGIIPFHDYG